MSYGKVVIAKSAQCQKQRILLLKFAMSRTLAVIEGITFRERVTRE